MEGYLDKASCWQAVLGKSVKQGRYICSSENKIEDIGLKMSLWKRNYNRQLTSIMASSIQFYSKEYFYRKDFNGKNKNNGNKMKLI
jgi:hypothetical protein